MLLYENIGHEHGYIPMEELCGIRAAGLGDTEQAITKPLSLEVATDLGGIVNGWQLPALLRPPAVGSNSKLDTAMAIPRKGNGIQPKGDARRAALVVSAGVRAARPPIPRS